VLTEHPITERRSAPEFPLWPSVGQNGSRHTPDRPRPSRRRAREPRRGAAKALAFIGGLALVLLFALRGGGSYDLVVRQEYGLVIWWVIAVGVGIGLLPRARLAAPTRLLLGALLAYALWTALSLTWTESSERTFTELARALDYLGVVLLLGLVVDRRTWRSAAAGLGAGALTVCLLALASRLAPSAFPIDWAGRTFRADRLDYPFGYWNAVGAWAAMSAGLALAWSAHESSRPIRALSLGLVPVACVVAYLTYSRTAVAAVALALVLVLAMSRNRTTALIHAAVAAAGTGLVILAIRDAPQIAHATGTAGAGRVMGALAFAAALGAAVAALTAARRTDDRRLSPRIGRPLGAAAAVAVILAAGLYGPHLASRAWDSFRDTGVTNAAATTTSRLTSLSGTRYNLWSVALHGFTAHPTGGTGAGSYQFLWSRRQADTESVRNAHSLWLENMAELGIPGLVLILILSGAALGVAIVARRRSNRRVTVGASTAVLCVFAVYLLSASVDWMWQSTAVTVLALAGVAVVAARMSGRRPDWRWPIRAGVTALAVVAGLVQIPGLISTIEIGRSQAAARSGNSAQALAWANDAVGAEPWAASAYEQRALVLEAQGRLGPAVADEHRAVVHEPTNYVHWLLLSRIETERGRYTVALADYRRARRLGRLAAVFELRPSRGRF
jgi:O-antigen ligase/polysaccharide polymerase Wzy-like membrane protein